MRKANDVSRRGRQRSRAAGLTITELLVGSILLGVSLAGVAELMSLCVVSNAKLTRQFDAQVGANVALDRIKQDVRMATEFVKETSEFGPKKVLSSRTLLLRLPIYYSDKRNESDSSAPQNSLNGITLPGYYLVVYEVIPDPERTGEFKLVTSSLKRELTAEDTTCSYRPNVTDQTITRGIIGPIDVGASAGSAPSKIFTYLAKNPVTNEFRDRLDAVKESALYSDTVVNGVSGVSIDLEVRRGDLSATTSNDLFDKTLGAHAEVCLRLPPNAHGPQDLGNVIYEE